jgi:hypothetical protein
MRSIPGVWLNESVPADRVKKIEYWAESIPCISEVWAFGPRLSDDVGFGSELDLGVRLADLPSEQPLDQRIKAWSTILSAALKVQVHLHIVGEPSASDAVLKAQLLHRTIFRR